MLIISVAFEFKGIMRVIFVFLVLCYKMFYIVRIILTERTTWNFVIFLYKTSPIEAGEFENISTTCDRKIASRHTH